MMGHTQQWIQTLQSNNSGEPQLIFSSATFGVRERDFARAVVGQKRVEVNVGLDLQLCPTPAVSYVINLTPVFQIVQA